MFDPSSVTKMLKTKVRQVCCQIMYEGAAPDSSDFIFIDPTDIDYFVSPRPTSSTQGTYVIDGDWDKRHTDLDQLYPIYSDMPTKNRHLEHDHPTLYPIEKCEHYKSFVAHFQESVPWERTQFFDRLTTDPERNYGTHFGDTEATIQDRLTYVDELYESIREHGVQLQSEFDDETLLSQTPISETTNEEIPVYIGRDGTIIHGRQGMHRVTIARILELDEIPVRVVGRHTQWQAIRARFLSASGNDSQALAIKSELGESFDQYGNHPDIQHLY